MERLQIPWLIIGPSGAGKLTQARKWIEEAHNGKITYPMETRNFTVGDGYEARVITSPYHFEIDIPNLSMQDKQIIGELLTTFFSSGDVLSGLRTSARKLVILRRAHSLSLPAAIRVRSIIQQYILPPEASGMLWITAREMTGPLALLEDAFVQYRVPRMPYSSWRLLEIPDTLKTEVAWEKLEGRKERAQELLKFFPDGVPPVWPRRVQDYYDELVAMLIKHATSGKAPNLNIVAWIRGRVYQALGMCQTGPEIIDSCAAALQRQYTSVEPEVFWTSMKALTTAEPHTSYRTPLSLEAGILALYETIRTNSRVEKPKTIANEYVESPDGERTAIAAQDAAVAAVVKAVVKRRAAPRKK
jgi:hypothetical protein